ncbi:V-type ATP synthase subunit I [Alistipes sp. OttesenSCG-928-L06]|nr:V-type ATP synthase subunit I [Alistipes sp. OttesenSCG-928-L06]
MIVPMIKYSFVLYHRDYEAFLAQLQELGLVDITVSGWEPTEPERRLMVDIDNQRKALADLKPLRKTPGRQSAEPFGSPEEALEQYVRATAEVERLGNEIAKTEKEIADLRPWGAFSKTDMEQLAKSGVKLHFYTAFAKDFNQRLDEWQKLYAVEKIAEENGLVYFVIVAGPDTGAVEINANEVKMPTYTWQEREVHLKHLQNDLDVQNALLNRAAESVEALEAYGKELRSQLHLSKVNTTAPREAEGSLVLMEGWAPVEDQANVDAFLDADDTAYAIKSEPEEEDDPPVQLKNNRFARLFELIGSFYSLPKYGTTDLTPYFAPFYMLFFGFCLADLGYGAIYVLAAIILRAIGPAKLKDAMSLLLLCGISTMFFGLLTGNAFGISLVDKPLFAGISGYMVNSTQLFYLAVGVGIVHILYAMTLKVIFTTKLQGFKYAASSLGWIIVIVSGLCAFLLPKFDIEGYTLHSVPFWVVTGIGLFMMLFLNSPGKNPFVNFGAGLWNTYNDVTGLLSDGLSYIRLFALGLSGGIQALVFNRLAMEMSPDIIIVKQLVMILILAVGHGITLFMASLSAFVHPLRLTFVEFYNNAGFVSGGRAFNPLKKEK